MKTLLLLRHAKAQPDAPSGDKARALTERGRRNATVIGRKLPEIASDLGLILSSDARRAEQTAEIVAAAAAYTGLIAFEPAIYDADLDTLLQVVRGLPENYDCVLMVGHNPGFEELCAALILEGTSPPTLPTAGLAHLELDATHWLEIRPFRGRLLGMYTPKNLASDT